MEKMTTRLRIMTEALKLFAQEGYEAVTVEAIANAVGIKAPSLYKHYKSKREIFESILDAMEQQDKEQANACSVPEDTLEKMPEAYAQSTLEDLIRFSRQQFLYWIQDSFAVSFRKMLTIEQYRSKEMNHLYQQYLGYGPLNYVADLLGSSEKALSFYGPMHILYAVYDATQDQSLVLTMLDSHLERWRKNEIPFE